MSEAPRNVHASALAFGTHGILIRGPARSGKSALAFSILRRAEILRVYARLIADDQVFLACETGELVARAPPTTFGLIEVSGVGIVREAAVASARIDLLIDLCERPQLERIPAETHDILEDVRVRRILVPAREAAFGADVVQGLLHAERRAEIAADPDATTLTKL